METNPPLEAAWAEFKAFLSGEAGLDAERRLSNRQDLSAVFPSEKAGSLVRLTIRDYPRKPIACLQAGLAAQVTTGPKARDFSKETARLSRLLEEQGLAWQHGEQVLSGGDFRIREYPEGPEDRLPDERFELRLRVLDEAHLKKEREAHRATARQLHGDLKLLKQVNEILQARAWWLPARDWNALVRRTEKARGKKYPGEPLAKGSSQPEADPADRSALRQMIQDLRHDLGDGKGWERMLKQRLAVVTGLFDQWELLPDPASMVPGLVLTATCVSEKRRRFTWERLSQAIYFYLKDETRGVWGDGKTAPVAKPVSSAAPAQPVTPVSEPAKAAVPEPAVAHASAAPAKKISPTPGTGTKPVAKPVPKASGEKKPSPPARTAPVKTPTVVKTDSGDKPPVSKPGPVKPKSATTSTPAKPKPVTAPAPAKPKAPEPVAPANLGFNLDEL